MRKTYGGKAGSDERGRTMMSKVKTFRGTQEGVTGERRKYFNS